eukprot:TRINITY_DN2609_c0_g1_i1.p1 TRINITY_DN2609_c0_g1~~TRINITY_DN2609_c0_g1_i1.p1  ORF type:complete len:592 (+),score=94.05 TRINITY_DN2609_c0_g1_i1:145-1920(+)
MLWPSPSFEFVIMDGPATIKESHARGNALFLERKIPEAIVSYTRALDAVTATNMADPPTQSLLSNRAQCHILLERGADALADIEAVLALNATHEKSLLRRVSALLLLQRPHDALQAVSRCPVGTERDRLEELAKRCLKEQVRGLYDEAEMMKECSAASPDLSRMHADFFASDRVEVAETGCVGGRGVKAKRNIGAGDLILAEKAFAITKRVPTCADPDAMECDHDGDVGSGKALDALAMTKLRSLRVEDRSTFCALTSGTVVDDSESLNASRVRAVRKCNNFEVISNDIADACERMDWHQELGRLPTEQEDADWGARREFSRRVGIWCTASLFNHSCCPNALYSFIGDFLFIRIVRSVEAGDEICVPYLDFTMPFQEREKKLDSWGKSVGGNFVCECERCVLSRSSMLSSSSSSLSLPALESSVDLLYRKAVNNKLNLIALPATAAMGVPDRQAIIRQLVALPCQCQTMLVTMCEIEAGDALERGMADVALVWCETEEKVRKVTGRARRSDMQRNQLMRAGVLLMLGRPNEAKVRLATARSICGAFLRAPSGPAFVGLCLTYCMVDDDPLLEALEVLAEQVDAAYHCGLTM